jgi:hypothetical protein
LVVFPSFRNLGWLSSGKIRAYTTVGNDAPWGVFLMYMTNQILLEVAYVFCTDTKNNGNLKPEMTISREIGLEMSFLNNRFGFDVSYYHTNTVDQIIPVAVSLRLVIQISSLMRVISRIKVSNCPYLERLLGTEIFLGT